ncbi:MAG: ferrous iron transport protein B [Akkermansia sp.]
MRESMPTIALLGNPNCGKTTIFNLLTGARQHVGNYSGVTVDSKSGIIRTDAAPVKLVDLPGIYRLGGNAPEEHVVTKVLSSGKVQAIVNVVDSTHLDRNLYLTLQLWHFNLPVILVLNMNDEAESAGIEFDIALMEKLLGVRVIRTSGNKGQGIVALKRAIKQVISHPRLFPRLKPVLYGEREDAAIQEIAHLLQECPEQDMEPDSFIAEKLLEGDEEFTTRFEAREESNQALMEDVRQLRQRLANDTGMPLAVTLADRRYGVISGLIKAVQISNRKTQLLWTDRIDSVATHRFFGIPLFLIAMYLVFYLTFTVGDPLVQMMEKFFNLLSDGVSYLLAGSPMIQSVLCDGVIGGVGGVLSFVPTILILFLCLALLEASGYMARAAFIMDRFMHKMGLHGKSFIPMLIGFGCTVPAIMATRSIESKSDRFATIFILPLMSCGARLPIFVLFISALFPSTMQAELLWGLYLLGIIIAVCTARLLKSTLFKGDDELFLLELPPYRMPSLKNLFLLMIQRAWMYLKKAGTIILFASLVLWVLNTFPQNENQSPSAQGTYSELNSQAEIPVSADTAQLQQSYSAQIGRFFEPVTQWAGMDWRTNSALIGALAAKEVFVSQLGILYSTPDVDDTDEEGGNAFLTQAIRANYTPLQGLSIMVFCLIAMPCMATFGIVRKETGSWAFAISQSLFLDALGLIMAILVYQFGLFI